MFFQWNSYFLHLQTWRNFRYEWKTTICWWQSCSKIHKEMLLLHCLYISHQELVRIFLLFCFSIALQVKSNPWQNYKKIGKRMIFSLLLDVIVYIFHPVLYTYQNVCEQSKTILDKVRIFWSKQLVPGVPEISCALWSEFSQVLWTFKESILLRWKEEG